jgi:thiamine pyrophosphate-dependent acetolactate synthase large subunit-like protein
MKRDLCGGLIRKHLKDDALVMCSLGSAGRTWRAQNAPQPSYYGSDPMGVAVAMGLGLALAQPGREVLLIGGDGDFVMNLGSLLTVVGAKIGNLKLAIFDNRRYETGGGQSLAGADDYSLAAIAKGAGFPYAVDIGDTATADAAIAAFLAYPGLAFAAVRIDIEASPYPPAPALAQVEERAIFMQGLADDARAHK